MRSAGGSAGINARATEMVNIRQARRVVAVARYARPEVTGGTTRTKPKGQPRLNPANIPDVQKGVCVAWVVLYVACVCGLLFSVMGVGGRGWGGVAACRCRGGVWWWGPVRCGVVSQPSQ